MLFSPENPGPGREARLSEFCVPPYKKKILGDDGKRITYINEIGNTLIEISDHIQANRGDGAQIGSPPHEIDFAIKSREDYENCRHLFIGNADKRYNMQWLRANARRFQDQKDYISTLWIHGPFSFLRKLLGTETAMIAPYDSPEWVDMMLRDHLKTSMEAAQEPIRAIRYDMSLVWEDCCGSTGPFIAPAMFDEMFSWWYREWKDFTKSMGVPWTMLDTDGDPTPLITRWYENGIDCMHPWEVNSVDMLKIADEYPQYIMMGGIYKHMFEPAAPEQVGRFSTTDIYKAIDQELERVLKPMCKRGGYFPSLDHWAYWAVDYKAYRYYCDKMLKFGKANTVYRRFLPSL
jgi:uroporphyrinogen decarboxylase